MQLTVNIDDETFSKIAPKLDNINLSDEELAELMKEGLKAYFSSKEFANKINDSIFEWNGYGSKDFSPRGQRIIAAAIRSEDFDDVSKHVAEIIKGKSKEILANAVAKIFIENIVTNNTYLMQNAIQNEVFKILNDHTNGSYYG